MCSSAVQRPGSATSAWVACRRFAFLPPGAVFRELIGFKGAVHARVIFVYGSEKLKEMWRVCGGAAVLKELDVSKIPRGAVLYTDLPLRTAELIS